MENSNTEKQGQDPKQDVKQDAKQDAKQDPKQDAEDTSVCIGQIIIFVLVIICILLAAKTFSLAGRNEVLRMEVTGLKNKVASLTSTTVPSKRLIGYSVLSTDPHTTPILKMFIDAGAGTDVSNSTLKIYYETDPATKRPYVYIEDSSGTMWLSEYVKPKKNLNKALNELFNTLYQKSLNEKADY